MKPLIEIRGVSLAVSDTLFKRYWKYKKEWWIDFVKMLKYNGYNTLCFWPYSNVLENSRFVNYFKYLQEEASKKGIKTFLILNHIDKVKEVVKIINTYPFLSFMFQYSSQSDSFTPGIEALKQTKKRKPTIIVRGYCNKPPDIAFAKNIFLKKFPEGKFWATKKFSFEHFAGDKPIPSTKQYSQAADGNLITWFQTCSDFDPFRMLSPEHIRICLKNAYHSGAKGFLFYPPHWWIFPSTTDKIHKEFEWERDWLWYEAFGKYSRNFLKSDKKYWLNRWENKLENKNKSASVLNAGIKSGKIIPSISQTFWYSVDFQYHPQTATNFHTLVPLEIYAGLYPRLKEFPSIVENIHKIQKNKKDVTKMKFPQVEILKSIYEQSYQAEHLLKSVIGNKEGEISCIYQDTEALRLLARFWYLWTETISKSYIWIASGENSFRDESISNLEESVNIYFTLADKVAKHYRGFVMGIWEEKVDWQEVTSQINSYKDEFTSKLKNFTKIPVLLSGDILTNNGWYCQFMDWPFRLYNILYFPIYKIVPFTIYNKQEECTTKLIIVQKDMGHLLPYRKQILSWVKNGGYLLLYNIEKNFNSEFFPSRIRIGTSSGRIVFREETHPLINGLQNEEIFCEKITCALEYDSDWKTLAVIDEIPHHRVLTGEEPAVFLVLNYGKGAIAFSGIRILEQEKSQYPTLLAKKTKIDLSTTMNWFKWAGIKIKNQKRGEK